MATPELVNPSDPDQLRLFAAACSLAPVIYGARRDAFDLARRPWADLLVSEKERYIVRGMELLKTLAPNAVVVTGLRPVAKVIGMITPPEADLPPDLCVFCSARPVEAGSDFCSAECRIDSERDR